MKILRELGDFNFDIPSNSREHLVIFLKDLSGDFSMRLHLQASAKVQLEQIIIGGETNIRINVELEKDAVFDQNSALKLAKNNSTNYFYFAEHSGKNSQSKVRIFGSLNDFAQKSSELKIHFKNGAKNAFGSEMERINLFGEHARNTAIPMIFSDEHEAQGRHSFGSGSISQDELEYLRARGIDSAKIKLILAKNDLLRVAKLTKQADIIEEINEY